MLQSLHSSHYMKGNNADHEQNSPPLLHISKVASLEELASLFPQFQDLVTQQAEQQDFQDGG
jgi:hypothetical protein